MPSQPSSESLLRSLLRDSSTYGVSLAVQRGFSFLLIPLYTAYFSPAGYGALELVFAVVQISHVALGLGAPQILLRFGSATNCGLLFG